MKHRLGALQLSGRRKRHHGLDDSGGLVPGASAARTACRRACFLALRAQHGVEPGCARASDPDEGTHSWRGASSRERGAYQAHLLGRDGVVPHKQVGQAAGEEALRRGEQGRGDKLWCRGARPKLPCLAVVLVACPVTAPSAGRWHLQRAIRKRSAAGGGPTVGSRSEREQSVKLPVRFKGPPPVAVLV